MSSWSCLLAAQGARYNGPEGFISFNPAVTPDNHWSFFTAAEGWGRFGQVRQGHLQKDVIKLAYGTLRINKTAFWGPANVKSAALLLNGKPVKSQVTLSGKRAELSPSGSILLRPGDTLVATLKW
jgi:hypothetical protein